MAQKKDKKPKLLFKRWTRRQWLNKINDGGIAFIRTQVSNVYDEKCYEAADGTIDIADCSRIITLEFFCDDDGTVNSIQKLDILMMAIGQFRDKLEEAMDAAKLSRANGKKKVALEEKEK